jgi:pyruvate/2-oxoglutarate dehydrogenase complex dihydrolipoamide acyltransferase (E2) component
MAPGQTAVSAEVTWKLIWPRRLLPPRRAAPTAAPVPRADRPGNDRSWPTSRLRQAIARRMTESKTTVPHFYVTSEIDMGAALALRQQINALLPEEQKVTVNDMIVKAAALALQEFPNLNAAFAGDKIVRHNRIHVGTAVAVEGGLLTVVQKNSNLASLAQIAADNRAMIGRARAGKMKPDDVEGGTFTISNLGAFDVDHFIAIINPPDAAILAVGSAREMPVVVNGQLGRGNAHEGHHLGRPPRDRRRGSGPLHAALQGVAGAADAFAGLAPRRMKTGGQDQAWGQPGRRFSRRRYCPSAVQSAILDRDDRPSEKGKVVWP